MDLAARFHDVSARSEHDLGVLGPEADFALEHDGELIFAVVDVGEDESADLEGVFDDGEGATGVGTVDLEDHPDAGHQFVAPTFTGLDNLDGRGRYGPCTHGAPPFG